MSMVIQTYLRWTPSMDMLLYQSTTVNACDVQYVNSRRIGLIMQVFPRNLVQDHNNNATWLFALCVESQHMPYRFSGIEEFSISNLFVVFPVFKLLIISFVMA